MEYQQQPIYSGPARGAKIAAIVVLTLFVVWVLLVWASDGDSDPGSDEPSVELEEGTLPPVVEGNGASTADGAQLPATP